ncbi:MAG: hypothetical protein LUF92_18015 [Clostridiales bacterium]|nr:hypothetical protein [Clostridiales bacterium]
MYLTGRRKNLIILSGGENVSPEELEKKLSQIPEISEVMVREKDDAICAEVYLQYDGAAYDEVRKRVEQSVKKINAVLPTFKQITSIEYREEPFEKTVTGKLLRYKKTGN